MKARTRLVVLGKFQKWFLFNFVFYTALFLTILSIGIFFWFRIVVYEIMQFAGLLSETFVATVQKNMELSVLILGIVTASLLVVAAIQSLWFSRRIAGPIFALARHLDQCEENGQIKHLNLRKDDLFGEVAEKFNRLADKLNQTKQA